MLLSMARVEAAPADWKEYSVKTNKELTSISCPDPRTCYVVSGLYLSGGSGAIFKTTDGGETFAIQKSPTLNPLHSISCASVSTCYAVGDFGTFLKTTDSGETWVESLVGSKANPPKFTGVIALSENKILAIGRDASLYSTENGGLTWMRPPIRTVADFFSIYFLDTRLGFITGDDGALFVTEDGGATWTYRSALRTAGKISSMYGDGKETVFAVGDGVYKSTDKGFTWSKQSATSKSNHAVTVAPSGVAYLLADMSLMLSTTDGGTTWMEELTSANIFLHGITCPSTGYCLVVGSSGKVFRLGTPPVAPTTVTPAPDPLPVSSPSAPGAEVSVTTATFTPKIEPVATVGSLSASAVLTRTLKRGAKGGDVKKLQELLSTDTSIYPEGEASGYFGPATAMAIGRFQEKYGLSKQGEAGYGDAGPRTRAKLIEVLEGRAASDGTAPPATTVAGAPALFTRRLKKGLSGDDVKKLQELLATDKAIYPEGEISGYFGSLTKKALGKFQEKYGLAMPDEVGYGEVGPKTRAKLIEVAP